MNDEPRNIKLIFAEAIEKPIDKRAEYLNNVCGEDADLRAEVEDLLKSHKQAGDFMESPALGAEVTLDDSAPTEGPGTVIGRYKLLERLGEGGMAVVYMAEQKRPIRRRVAVKLIKLGMDTKSVIARFEAERQALAMMDHPNIAKVLDAGTTESGRPYFVMELVRGVSITDFCDQNRLSTRQRLELFISVCQAVHHAHQKGIIHRDIKPSNVMVTLHDGQPVVKVIDFGIAKAVNQELTEKTVFTRYAQMIGTPQYMSPEQAEMSGLGIDVRTDVFSLGVLLYELLTGTTPFDAEDLRDRGYAEIQRIIREEEPIRPSTRISTLGKAMVDIAKSRQTSPEMLAKRIREELDWIAMKTLEKDRNRRYDSVSELAADIKRHLKQEPVLAGPPSKLYVARKFVQRHRVMVGAVAVALAGVLTALIFSTCMYVQAQRALRRESTARSETQLVSDFFTDDLLASVYPENTKGQDVTVRYILDNAVKNIDQKLKDSPLSEAKIRETVGLAYRKLGDYQNAEPHLLRALKIRREHLGPEHPSTLAAMGHLGSLYIDHGRFRESEPLLIEAIEVQSRVLGEKHADTFESMGMLGWQYVLEGRVNEAGKLIEEVLTVGASILGEEHPAVLKAISSRAYRHTFNREFAEAESLARRGLRISQRVLGDEHEQSLYFMTLITHLYGLNQQHKAGTGWAIKTLEICQRVLGDEHPATLLAMRKLGDIYKGQGLLEQASPLLTKSAELSARVLGEKHLFTLQAMYGLAVLYQKQENHDEADALICHGLRSSLQVPDLNPNMHNWFKGKASSRINRELRPMANSHYDAGDYENALQVLGRIEEMQKARNVGLGPVDLALKAMSLTQTGENQQAQDTLSQLRKTYDEQEYLFEPKELYEAERFCVGKDDTTFAIWHLLAEGELEKGSALFRALQETPDFEAASHA